jgi:type II secretory pathway component PulJ
MTLLELVLAIALLGSVVTAGGWWMRVATQRATQTHALLQRESATNALLDAIGRDLESGDLATDSEKLPKVRVSHGALTVLTRSVTSDVGAVFREYSLRPQSGDVVALERSVDISGKRAAAPIAHVVLGQVKRFDAAIDARFRTITVELESIDGTLSTRRWTLP